MANACHISIHHTTPTQKERFLIQLRQNVLCWSGAHLQDSSADSPSQWIGVGAPDKTISHSGVWLSPGTSTASAPLHSEARLSVCSVSRAAAFHPAPEHTPYETFPSPENLDPPVAAGFFLRCPFSPVPPGQCPMLSTGSLSDKISPGLAAVMTGPCAFTWQLLLPVHMRYYRGLRA